MVDGDGVGVEEDGRPLGVVLHFGAVDGRPAQRLRERLRKFALPRRAVDAPSLHAERHRRTLGSRGDAQRRDVGAQ